MRDNHALLAVVIDRSGSMSNIIEEIVASYNNFIEDQRTKSGTASVFLAAFDDQYEVIYNNVNIQDVTPITVSQVSPRGSTALNDAFGRTISQIGASLSNLPEDERPSKVIVAVFTDGEENWSREYRQSQVAEMVKHQQDKYNWVFQFFGANQNAILTGAKYSIPRNNSITFKGTRGAAGNTVKYMSAATSYFRSVDENVVSNALASKGRVGATLDSAVSSDFYNVTDEDDVHSN